MEYIQGPLAVQMVTQVLQWNSIDAETAAPVIADKILAIVIAEDYPRALWNWCTSGEAPTGVARLSRKWAELLYSSVTLHIFSADRRKSMLDVSKALPMWRCDSPTGFCAPHRALDGFTARFDDPIWERIYPPNGWVCGCSVLSARDGGEIGFKASKRIIPPEIVLQCTSWIDKRPDRELAQL